MGRPWSPKSPRAAVGSVPQGVQQRQGALFSRANEAKKDLATDLALKLGRSWSATTPSNFGSKPSLGTHRKTHVETHVHGGRRIQADKQLRG